MEIEKIDYLIVDCGYTSRLEDSVDDVHIYFNEECEQEDIKCLFINDRVWGNGLIEYTKCGLHAEFVKKKHNNKW